MFNRTLRMLLVMAFAAVALVGLNGTATADSDAKYTWVTDYDYRQSDGDKGGRSISETVYSPGEGGYNHNQANFHALDEVLHIRDEFDNGHPTVAKLWVGGSGPAVYYAKGWGWSAYDLSYAEGQTVYLQVCTSDHPNAACTSKTKYKGVS